MWRWRASCEGLSRHRYGEGAVRNLEVEYGKVRPGTLQTTCFTIGNDLCAKPMNARPWQVFNQGCTATRPAIRYGESGCHAKSPPARARLCACAVSPRRTDRFCNEAIGRGAAFTAASRSTDFASATCSSSGRPLRRGGATTHLYKARRLRMHFGGGGRGGGRRGSLLRTQIEYHCATLRRNGSRHDEVDFMSGRLVPNVDEHSQKRIGDLNGHRGSMALHRSDEHLPQLPAWLRRPAWC